MQNLSICMAWYNDFSVLPIIFLSFVNVTSFFVPSEQLAVWGKRVAYCRNVTNYKCKNSHCKVLRSDGERENGKKINI